MSWRSNFRIVAVDKSAVRQGRNATGTESRKAGLPIVTSVKVACWSAAFLYRDWVIELSHEHTNAIDN